MLESWWEMVGGIPPIDVAQFNMRPKGLEKTQEPSLGGFATARIQETIRFF